MLARLALLALLAPLAMPAAEGAVRITGLDIGAEPFDLAEGRPVHVRAEADCVSLVPRAAALGQPMQPVPAPVTLSPSGGFLFLGPPTLDFPIAPCHAGEATVATDGLYQLTATREVPALVQYTMRFDVALPVLGHEAAPLDPAADGRELTASVRPSLVTDASVADRVQSCACTRLEFHGTLSNAGNARTTYSFRVGTAPEGWEVGLPSPITLDSPLTGDPTSAPFTFTVTPSAAWVSGVVQVDVMAHATDQPASVAPAIPIQMLLSNSDARARYESAPAPAPLPLTAVFLAAVALLASLRRRA